MKIFGFPVLLKPLFEFSTGGIENCYDWTRKLFEKLPY